MEPIDYINRLDDRLAAQHEAVMAQLMALSEKVETAAREGAVHHALCDNDRADLRKNVDRYTDKMWKVILLLVTSGGVGGSAGVALAKALGGEP